MSLRDHDLEQRPSHRPSPSRCASPPTRPLSNLDADSALRPLWVRPECARPSSPTPSRRDVTGVTQSGRVTPGVAHPVFSPCRGQCEDFQSVFDKSPCATFPSLLSSVPPWIRKMLQCFDHFQSWFLTVGLCFVSRDLWTETTRCNLGLQVPRCETSGRRVLYKGGCLTVIMNVQAFFVNFWDVPIHLL